MNDFGQKRTKSNGHSASPDSVAKAQPAGLPIMQTGLGLSERAGVVLLWPFLPAFFRELGLLTNRAFTNIDTHRRAVLLLHCLASTKAAAQEPALVMEKLLCGMDTQLPTCRNITLTDHEQETLTELLDAVRAQWAVLAGSSNESLQQTFLTREGRLTRAPDGALHLRITQGPFDMLLDSLPWGLSRIQLPWMTEVLHVEWR